MSALFAPGSSPWLLRHEVRLALRSLATRGGGRRGWIRWGLAALVIGGAGGAVGVGHARLLLIAHAGSGTPGPAASRRPVGGGSRRDQERGFSPAARLDTPVAGELA